MTKTRARLKINQILAGEKTNLRVVGCLLFQEWDEKEGRFYYWEEWEITGLAEYDSWIEYDHSDQTVSLYEPLRFTQSIDPQQLQKGQSFTLHERDGAAYIVVVDEVGVGQIIDIQGKNAYQVFPGEMMAYATLRDNSASKKRRLITIEKYNNREYDAYRKVRLSSEEQKRLFGRVIRPRDWLMVSVITACIIGIFAIVIIAIINGHQGGQGGVRGVYGGSSGGFGK